MGFKVVRADCKIKRKRQLSWVCLSFDLSPLNNRKQGINEKVSISFNKEAQRNSLTISVDFADDKLWAWSRLKRILTDIFDKDSLFEASEENISRPA